MSVLGPSAGRERVARSPRGRNMTGTIVILVLFALLVSQARRHQSAAPLVTPVEVATAHYLNAFAALTSPVATRPQQSASCLEDHCSLGTLKIDRLTATTARWRFSDAPLAHPPASDQQTPTGVTQGGLSQRLVPVSMSRRNSVALAGVAVPALANAPLQSATSTARLEAEELAAPGTRCVRTSCSITAAAGATVVTFAYQHVIGASATIDVVVRFFHQAAVLRSDGSFESWKTVSATENGRVALHLTGGHWLVSNVRLASVDASS